MISMFMIMQLIVCIGEYSDVSVPAQTEIYLSSLTGFVFFESISPDMALEMMYPKILSKKYTVDEWITGKEKEFNPYLDAKGKSSASFLDNF